MASLEEKRDDTRAVHRRHRFYARFVGNDQVNGSYGMYVPYPDSYEIWEKIGVGNLGHLDRRDVEDLRALCDDILSSWGK